MYTEHAKEAHCHSEEDAVYYIFCSLPFIHLQNSTHKYATVKLIPLDLPRTFPALQFFQVDSWCFLACLSWRIFIHSMQSDGPWMDSLREILEATVCYRPDIGYVCTPLSWEGSHWFVMGGFQVQGMSYLAAMFLLCMDTYDSFQCLANVLGRQFLLDFFQMDMPAVCVADNTVSVT